MATLYISEHYGADSENRSHAQAAITPAITTQAITITGSSTASVVFNPETRLVRLHTDAICSVLFGAAPVATASHSRMAADQTEYFAVVPGQKVAVISNT